jgi:hypothetical protein
VNGFVALDEGATAAGGNMNPSGILWFTEKNFGRIDVWELNPERWDSFS